MKWQDILIVKHKCPPSIGMDADRKVHSQRDRAEKLAKRRHERRAAFEPLPVQHRLVTSGAIRAMCRDLESIGSGSVVRGLLESNDCQSTLFRRDAVVYHDHPFMVPSKPPPSCRDKVSWPSHMLFPAPTVKADFILRTLLDEDVCGCDSPLVRALPLPEFSTIEVENMHGITLTVAVQDLLLLKNVCLSAAGAQRLEERTQEQNKSALWMSARSKRLTASLFGRVCKMRDTTNRQPLVDQIISSRNVSTMATRWGNDHQATAIGVYCAKTENTVTHSGLVVDPKYCWLGASPDGLVFDQEEDPMEGLLEVKCPFTERDRHFSDVTLRKQDRFLVHGKEGQPLLNKRHDYYYQVHGQLALTRRKWCDFGVFTNDSLFIERIWFDSKLWEEMIPRLNTFFFEHLPKL